MTRKKNGDASEMTDEENERRESRSRPLASLRSNFGNGATMPGCHTCPVGAGSSGPIQLDHNHSPHLLATGST